MWHEKLRPRICIWDGVGSQLCWTICYYRSMFFKVLQPTTQTSLEMPCCTLLRRASQKITIAEKSLAFSNHKSANRKFYCRNRRKIARKSQKKSQKNRCDFLGCGIKIAAFPRFQNRCVFGTLSSFSTSRIGDIASPIAMAWAKVALCLHSPCALWELTSQRSVSHHGVRVYWFISTGGGGAESWCWLIISTLNLS